MWKVVTVVSNIIYFSFSEIFNKVSLENLLDITIIEPDISPLLFFPSVSSLLLPLVELDLESKVMVLRPTVCLGLLTTQPPTLSGAGNE